MGDSPDTRRTLAVVPLIRIRGTTARLRRGSGAARGTLGCRVGGTRGEFRLFGAASGECVEITHAGLRPP
jgi:hypothetical protein